MLFLTLSQSENVLDMYRCNRQVFPTPEAPSTITFKSLDKRKIQASKFLNTHVHIKVYV